MEDVHVSKAIGAGFVATSVMMIMIYTAPMMGMPKIDVAAMVGSLFSGEMPQPSLALVDSWEAQWPRTTLQNKEGSHERKKRELCACFEAEQP